MPIAIKRAYEKASSRDGYRILVDGLWPRGLTKEKLKIAEWMRAIAPSTRLRNWYGHRPENWEGFQKKYRRELARPPRKQLIDDLAWRARKKKVTLVFGARDAERSNAAVVADVLKGSL